MELKVWRIFVACDVSGMESAKKEEEANNLALLHAICFFTFYCSYFIAYKRKNGFWLKLNLQDNLLRTASNLL